MNIFKQILNYFKKWRSRFLKSNQKKRAIERIEEVASKKLEVVDEKIQDFIIQDEKNTEQINKVLEEKTLIELGQALGNDRKEPVQNRELIFDLVEMEQEVISLNKKLFEIEAKSKRIEFVSIPHKFEINKDIEELERIFQGFDNKENLRPSIEGIDNINDKSLRVDKFFQEFRLIKIFRTREEKRQIEEQIKKRKVNELIQQLEQTINLDKLDEAKQFIRVVERAISGLKSPVQKSKFRGKLSGLKEIFRKKEIEKEAKRQAAKLKREKEEAERRIKEEEARREKEHKRKEQEEQKLKQQEEAKRKKEEQKKQRLQNLLTKKSNWQEFKKVLQENRVSTLYHFTDRANIPSIKKYGGLFSWYYCDKDDITILKPGGDTLSRDLDRKYRLHDFVRLSFCNDHPMEYRLKQTGYDLVLLTIDIEVSYFENTCFSDMNATDKNHNHGFSIADLKRISFSATKKSYVRKEDPDFKFHQAEVLVKTWIPIKYITNINQF